MSTEVPGQRVIGFSSEYMTVSCIYSTVLPLILPNLRLTSTTTRGHYEIRNKNISLCLPT